MCCCVVAAVVDHRLSQLQLNVLSRAYLGKFGDLLRREAASTQLQLAQRAALAQPLQYVDHFLRTGEVCVHGAVQVVAQVEQSAAKHGRRRSGLDELEEKRGVQAIRAGQEAALEARHVRAKVAAELPAAPKGNGVTVNGSENVIHIEEPDAIIVPGYGNSITYSRGNPAIDEIGADVTVQQRD